VINPYDANIGLQSVSPHHCSAIQTKKRWDGLTTRCLTLLFLQSVVLTCLCIGTYRLKTVFHSPEIAFWLPAVLIVLIRRVLRKAEGYKEIATFVIAIMTSVFLGIVFRFLGWNEQYILRNSDNVLLTCFKLILTSERLWFTSMLVSYIGFSVIVFRKILFLRYIAASQDILDKNDEFSSK